MGTRADGIIEIWDSTTYIPYKILDGSDLGKRHSATLLVGGITFLSARAFKLAAVAGRAVTSRKIPSYEVKV